MANRKTYYFKVPGTARALPIDFCIIRGMACLFAIDLHSPTPPIKGLKRGAIIPMSSAVLFFRSYPASAGLTYFGKVAARIVNAAVSIHYRCRDDKPNYVTEKEEE